MGGIFGGGSTPQPAAVPAAIPAATPPVAANAGIAAAAASSRSKASALAGGGQDGTGGPLGNQGSLSAPPTASAKLLGATQ